MGSNKARFQKLMQSTNEQEKPILTFDDLLNHPLYGDSNLTPGQLERLEPWAFAHKSGVFGTGFHKG